jgi:acyl-CoA synthetase (AMP-forming)/AMP-acid ligase II
MGAIVHTINPRLHEDQVAYIANHAEDQYIFFDLTFLPLIKLIAGRCTTVKAFIAMTDQAHMPTGEELLAFYEGKIAKWWTPDDVVFVDTIPLGATGKVLKNRLREQFGDHLLVKAVS